MVKTLLLHISLLFFSSLTLVVASEQFYTKYVVDYVFDPTGAARVNQTISLTNKQSNLYASAYQMTIQGDPPTGISGSDSTGPLTISTEHPGVDTTLIKIGFNDQVVGKDQTLTFNLSYTGRPAAHNGQVWEVILPKIGSLELIDDYTLHLTVPDSFGQPAFISPSPVVTSDLQYTFSKDQISRVGVVANFGKFQTFDFSLDYKIVNPNSKSAVAEVSIPGDTNYQRVHYATIDPPASDIRVDSEGNWLAKFKLAPQQTLTVHTTGQAHLLAEPSRTQSGLTTQQRQDYLRPTTYWPATASQITALARQLTTPETIYNYVIKTLTYDYTRARPGAVRKGGAAALVNPATSICTEFTDLFISLARAAGIPAREVNGYAYTTDKKLRPLADDIFHAWPQYWDNKQQVWISIDPTWGSTTGGVDYFHKLDFNHFAFITRGLSDSSPAISSENVRVSFGIFQDWPAPPLDISWQQPQLLWPLVANSSIITVVNFSGSAIYRFPISDSTTNIVARYSGSGEIDILPPFSTRQYSIEFTVPFWPNFQTKNLTIVLGNQTKAYNISARLFLAWQIVLALVVAIIITALGWLATKAWGIYIQKRYWNSSIRG